MEKGTKEDGRGKRKKGGGERERELFHRLHSTKWFQQLELGEAESRNKELNPCLSYMCQGFKFWSHPLLSSGVHIHRSVEWGINPWLNQVAAICDPGILSRIFTGWPNTLPQYCIIVFIQIPFLPSFNDVLKDYTFYLCCEHASKFRRKPSWPF